MAEALAGNLGAVDKAIDKALDLDVDAADIRILKGYVAYVSGRSAESIDHFQQAIKRRPSSVMAHALLAMAYDDLMQFDEEDEISRKIETLKVELPEDLLFKGALLANWDPKRGLLLMDEAMTIRPMNIGYLMRCDARCWWAMEVSDLSEMERALEEAATARQLFRGYPKPILSSLWAETSACIVYGHHHLVEKRSQALTRARKYAEELKAYPDYIAGLPARCDLAWVEAFDENKSLVIPPELTKMRERTGDLRLTWYEALMLYRAGRDADALRVLNSLKRESRVDELRVLVMLGLPDQKDRVSPILEDWSRDHSSIYKARCLFSTRLALGQADLARTEMRRKLEVGLKLWPLPNGLETAFRTFYLSNDPGREDQLVRSAAGVRSARAQAHSYVGLRQLGSGQRGEAMLSFQKTAETRALGMGCWFLSLAFLERMKVDPNWPAWAGAKK